MRKYLKFNFWSNAIMDKLMNQLVMNCFEKIQNYYIRPTNFYLFCVETVYIVNGTNCYIL